MSLVQSVVCEPQISIAAFEVSTEPTGLFRPQPCPPEEALMKRRHTPGYRPLGWPARPADDWSCVFGDGGWNTKVLVGSHH
jgi:hypothetical protein